MSKRPLKFCSVPGCPSMAKPGRSRCDKHEAEAFARTDAERPSAAVRGYDETWRRVRAEKLRLDPACELCGGRADTVHHRVPIREGGARLDLDNLVSLCRACHSRVHPEKGGHPL